MSFGLESAMNKAVNECRERSLDTAGSLSQEKHVGYDCPLLSRFH